MTQQFTTEERKAFNKKLTGLLQQTGTILSDVGHRERTAVIASLLAKNIAMVDEPKEVLEELEGFIALVLELLPIYRRQFEDLRDELAKQQVH